MAVVYNPSATNPIKPKLLPAQDDYITRKLDEQTYQLERVERDQSPKPIEEVKVG